MDTSPAPSGAVEWWLLLNNAKEKEILEDRVYADFLKERPQLKLNLTVIAAGTTSTPSSSPPWRPAPRRDRADQGLLDERLPSARRALAELDAYVKADKIDLAGKHGAARLVSTQEAGRTYALPFTTVTLHQFFNPDLCASTASSRARRPPRRRPGTSAGRWPGG